MDKMSVEKGNIKFYLHSPSNSTKIKRCYDLKLNPQQPVKVLIHGWLDHKYSFWYASTVEAYLQKGEFTIITVDWSKYSRQVYSKAVECIKNVAEHIGDFLIEMVENYNIPFGQFHLIGHSLGAHISGIVGKQIFAYQDTKLGRITGLDPAGPDFKNASPQSRLSSDDAIFVDVIHTDGGRLGYEKSLGHVDFFPCGGKRPQNGCSSMGGDSHDRAASYFAESISTNDFIAVKDSLKHLHVEKVVYAVMGENCNWDVRGNFYLDINKETPFAMGYNNDDNTSTELSKYP